MISEIGSQSKDRIYNQKEKPATSCTIILAN